MPLLLSILMLASLPLAAFAEAPEAPIIPGKIEYRAWLEQLGAQVSPFYEHLFSWNEAQEKMDLPTEVSLDPQGLFVSVRRPLAETIKMEDSGEIEESVTVGLESYGVVDAPIELVLETVLFRSGKPVGKTEGSTRPVDSIFGSRRETIRERWGAGAYYITNNKTGGGLVRDQNDSYAMIVRGSPQQGYLVFSSFLAPVGVTETKSAFTIVRLRALPDGKTDYRITSRYQGQP